MKGSWKRVAAENAEKMSPGPVAIVGNVNEDLILGAIDDYPAWGTEVVAPDYHSRPGGAAANTALALGNLGLRTTLLANIGADYTGTEILAALREAPGAAIDTSRLQILDGVQTGLSVGISKAPGKERSFITVLGTLNHFGVADLESQAEFLEGCRLILLCGYFLLPGLRRPELSDLLRKLKQAAQRPPLILLDTGWSPDGWTDQTRAEVQRLLSVVDIFLPNRVELEAVTKLPDRSAAVSTILAAGPKALVVKEGSRGSSLYTPAGQWEVAAIATDVVDTVGAGDYFNAGFIWGLAEGCSPVEAMQRGNVVAALNISRDAGRLRLATRTEVEARLLEARVLFQGSFR